MVREPTCMFFHTPQRTDFIQTSETSEIFQFLFATHSQVRLSCELSLAVSLLILFGLLMLESPARLAKFRFIHLEVCTEPKVVQLCFEVFDGQR